MAKIINASERRRRRSLGEEMNQWRRRMTEMKIIEKRISKKIMARKEKKRNGSKWKQPANNRRSYQQCHLIISSGWHQWRGGSEIIIWQRHGSHGVMPKAA